MYSYPSKKIRFMEEGEIMRQRQLRIMKSKNKIKSKSKKKRQAKTLLDKWREYNERTNN